MTNLIARLQTCRVAAKICYDLYDLCHGTISQSWLRSLSVVDFTLMEGCIVNLVQALVLCGGESSRMGSKKENLQISGVTLLEYISNIAQQAIELQFKTNLPVLVSGPGGIEDVVPGMGPLAGIHAALRRFQQTSFAVSPKFLLVLPVDLPLLRPSALFPLLSYADKDYDAVAFESSAVPMLLKCSPKAFQVVESLLSSRENSSGRSLRALLKRLNSRQIYKHDGLDLMNCNTPRDWSFAQDILELRTKNAKDTYVS